MRLITPKLIEEIEKKRELTKGELYREARLVSLTRLIKEEARYNFNSRTGTLAAHEFGGVPLRIYSIEQTVNNLLNAFEYGFKNFDGRLDEEFIKVIYRKIEPEKRDSYREGTIRFACDNNNIKIPKPSIFQIKNYIYDTNYLLELAGDGKLNPVEAAVYAHLHLIRLHPFADGNGRTARTIQNIILLKNEYPSPFICKKERKFYNNLIGKVMLAFEGRPLVIGRSNIDQIGATEEEKTFLDYIATKINTSLDKLIESTEEVKK